MGLDIALMDRSGSERPFKDHASIEETRFDISVGAYIQFAEMVAGGCKGVNPALDAMFKADLEAIS